MYNYYARINPLRKKDGWGDKKKKEPPLAPSHTNLHPFPFAKVQFLIDTYKNLNIINSHI